MLGRELIPNHTIGTPISESKTPFEFENRMLTQSASGMGHLHTEVTASVWSDSWLGCVDAIPSANVACTHALPKDVRHELLRLLAPAGFLAGIVMLPNLDQASLEATCGRKAYTTRR